MLRYDSSQRRALELEARRHAVVLGAPGTGKTALLVERFARLIERDGWGDGDALVLAPSRRAASELRSRVERRLERAFGGAPVRTPASLAFSVLGRAAAIQGLPAPRLLTGTVHDEMVADALADAAEASGLADVFGREVLQSAAFRGEMRELARVLDDFGLTAAELDRMLSSTARRGDSAYSVAPDAELLERWRAALPCLAGVDSRLRRERAGELTSSGLLREATRVVGAEGLAAEGLPRLLLIDDAQELSEGALALAAALAARGTSVWVYGDPDIATAAFQGERTAVLAGLDAELERRGAPRREAPAQTAVLDTVHRHGPELRGFVRDLTRRIGAAGVGEQRAAEAAAALDPGDASADRPALPPSPVRVDFARAAGASESLGAIAYRLRQRRLGYVGPGAFAEPVPWGDMAVLCRTRGEVDRVMRVLAGLQVPTSGASGGVVLREHRIVRELIRLLQHSLGLVPLQPRDLLEILGGAIGGLDPIALRRLRAALMLEERRAARAAGTTPDQLDAVLARYLADPGGRAPIDSPAGRALHRLARLAERGVRVREAGGTARETAWALWDGTRLAERWQREALDGRGSRSEEAHRALDAVLALFFALQRHEEQDSTVPIAQLLTDLLAGAVPEDTLAARAERDVVTVTTPQGAIGREFSIVAVAGPQDGVWPNLRSRGSLLGARALERWLRGGEAAAPSRRDTLHDELRLFAQACSRARRELLVVAVSDDDQQPSAFFAFGAGHLVDGLPTTRLTLRGLVAEMRRRLVRDPADDEALRTLVALSREKVAGAHPDEWYGGLAPSTAAPLVPLDDDPEARVRVSPSQLERAERCPLDWVIAALSGGDASVGSSLGTLVHHALERVAAPDAERMLQVIDAEWHKLPFEAEWESERTRRLADTMVRGVVDYLSDTLPSATDQQAQGEADAPRAGQLLAAEVPLSVEVGRAELTGTADRLELLRDADGALVVRVVDLKTGSRRPSEAELPTHAQLLSYQLAVDAGGARIAESAGAGRADAEGEAPPEMRSGGASLLFVRPTPAEEKKGITYVLRSQQPIDDEARDEFEQRVASIAPVMAASAFAARVEHHCANPFALGGACRLHIVPAVSHA